jgi:hypothetical protein
MAAVFSWQRFWDFFPSLTHPEWLMMPSSGYQRAFSLGVKVGKCEANHSHPVLRLRMNRALPS